MEIEAQRRGGGEEELGKWRFQPNSTLMSVSSLSVRGVLTKILTSIDQRSGDKRPMIPLGHADPSVFPCFRTTPIAVGAVVSALQSGQYNCYSPCSGLVPARRALAKHLSADLPYELSHDDVHLTNGSTQAIEIVVSILAQPGANILLPRPGYMFYEARAIFNGVEVRYFNLLPEKGWEVDLSGLEALADKNTVAMVIVNPGNPSGNVFSYQHLLEIANVAKKLGIMVISDEAYAHLTFGSKPFVPMGVFGTVVPVLTLGTFSKRWVVPGWRIGWITTNDPTGVLKKTKMLECLENYLDISTDPTTFVQGAIPEIIENTTTDFFNKTIELLHETADICYDKVKDIKAITCLSKPEGSLFVMVKLELSELEGIEDDMDFCYKLAKEQRVIVLPGCAVGLNNWLRITFSIDPSSLEDGLERLKSFCLNYAKLEFTRS